MRGEQSTLAPTSIITTGVPEMVGNTPARAGRSTPCTTPWTILAVAMIAPVFPALTDALRETVAHQPGGDAERAVALGPDRLGGAVVHGDLLAGMDHLDGEVARAVVILQFALYDVFPAYQDYFNVEALDGPDGPFHFVTRGVITAHRVYGNGQHLAAYSWTTSITSRPLYWPQWGQARCGSFCS